MQWLMTQLMIIPDLNLRILDGEYYAYGFAVPLSQPPYDYRIFWYKHPLSMFSAQCRRRPQKQAHPDIFRRTEEGLFFYRSQEPHNGNFVSTDRMRKTRGNEMTQVNAATQPCISSEK
jgi:hypothetical protein